MKGKGLGYRRVREGHRKKGRAGDGQFRAWVQADPSVPVHAEHPCGELSHTVVCLVPPRLITKPMSG